MKLTNLTPLRTQRIRAFGWVHRLRDQKEIIFIVLRDGTGYLQCVLSGEVARTYEALTLTLESTIEVVGTLKVVPEGQKAPGGHELVVDYWKVLGAAPGGDEAFTNRLNEVSPVFNYVHDARVGLVRVFPWPFWPYTSCVWSRARRDGDG